MHDMEELEEHTSWKISFSIRDLAVLPSVKVIYNPVRRQKVPLPWSPAIVIQLHLYPICLYAFPILYCVHGILRKIPWFKTKQVQCSINRWKLYCVYTLLGNQCCFLSAWKNVSRFPLDSRQWREPIGSPMCTPSICSNKTLFFLHDAIWISVKRVKSFKRTKDGPDFQGV
jgi:hypothetical protein